jgi:8-oxo-dGTP diphosphatase
VGRAFLRAQTPAPRAKLEYTSLAEAFCVCPFTFAELCCVNCVVWGVELDPRKFHRKLTTTKGFVVPSGGTTSRGGRPVRLHLVGAADILRPPLMRPDNPKRGRSR